MRQVDLDGTPHVTDPILVEARGTMDVEKTSAPSGFRLDQNFPNPFNPTTTIGYSLEKAGKVTLKVYTELGQLVTTLVDEAQSPGPHSVVFSSTGVARSSGAYFYTLQTERHTVTRKMALVK